jgi:hypothetical protein
MFAQLTLWNCLPTNLNFLNFPQNVSYVKKQTSFGCNIQHMKIKLPKAHTSEKRPIL